jgi:hypothetical protein
MSIEAREIARRYILGDANESGGLVSIGEFLSGEDGAEELTEAEHDALCEEIDELISHAMVTVTLSGDAVCTHCGVGPAEQAAGGEA